MKLPKKVNPDNIREAVVEIHYSSELPFEILLGMVYKALDDTYFYANRPLNPPPSAFQAQAGQQMTIQVGNVSHFYREKVSMQMRPGSFIFTCINNYIGWENYFREISSALEQLSKINEIQKWVRVGIRYISEFPETDLLQVTKFKYEFGLPDFKSKSSSFRSELEYKKSRVVLNLNNNISISRFNNTDKSIVNNIVSTIDVDIIDEIVENLSLEGLLNLIDNNHTKEKEIYFSLLKEDFVKSLNPEY